MKKSALLVALTFIFILQLAAQPACRRNSTGIAYTTTLIDGSYNFAGANFDASRMCLPPMTVGAPCTIRIPLTLTTYAGTYGSYSIVNCGLDYWTNFLLLPIVLLTGLTALKRKQTKSDF
jgi:hypothetical protein